MLLSSASPSSRSVAVRAVALVVALLVLVMTSVAALVVFLIAPEHRTPLSVDGPTGGRTPPQLAEAVQRTLAAGSARIDATYRPARGPTVSITGRTSLADAESEVFASVGGGPAAVVRVTSGGAWLQPPGSTSWTPVPVEQIAGAAAARGWADVLRDLDSSSGIRTDASGRIVAVQLAPDRSGGRLELRLSEFGTEVGVAVPP